MAKLIVGKNDLMTLRPELALEWHESKNGTYLPQNFTAHSGYKAWWKGKCGHEWPATIGSRSEGKGCPYCSNSKVLLGYNDLQSLFPVVAEEWDYLGNKLLPTEELAGSHHKANWICSECGHHWVAEIRMRTKGGQGCPECGKRKMGDTLRANKLNAGAQSLETAYPDIAKEWDYERNGNVYPKMVLPNSNMKVYWKCVVCNYSWLASVNNRTNGQSGCPACTNHIVVAGKNDLATVYPQLAHEWHPTKNYSLSPSQVGAGSREKVWWMCKFGHEFQCRINDRVSKNVGCKECSKRFQKSLSEYAVEYYIRLHFPDNIANFRPEYLNGKELDIYIPTRRTAIEYDGSAYHKNVDRDITKDGLCNNNGITLIRIRESKCPNYQRADKTFWREDQTNKSLSDVIIALLSYLGVNNIDVDVDRDIYEIKASFYSSAIQGSIFEMYPSLAEEWDYVGNKGLTPRNIPATKSKDKYSWICKVCGYVWSAALSERINGTGCPLCKNKVVIPGINDLATTHPNIASEWNYEKNAPLLPNQITKSYTESVWWKCSVCGYEWHVRVKNRVSGSGCNKCAAKKRGQSMSKEVYQYSQNRIFIKKYDSLKAAASETGISKSSIQHVCAHMQGYSQAAGYIWSYEPLENISEVQ